MPTERDRYVVKNTSGGWDVKAGGAEKPESHHGTQAEAEAAAKATVKRLGGGEVRIQGENFSFRDSDTVPPGNDPRSSKDKRH